MSSCNSSAASSSSGSKSCGKKPKAQKSTSITKKKEDDPRNNRPPYDLYQDALQPSFDEGWHSVVRLLKGKKRIVVLTGAGISVSCGIPDFRSKGTGLYSTLDAEGLGLSSPEELFDLEVFQENPQPFFCFARNLYYPLGTNERVRPSDSHKLLALLETSKMLQRVYSQNIDGLEQEAGVSAKKVVYAHGSLQWATCCKCRRKVSAKEMEADILNGTVARCQAPVVNTTTEQQPTAITTFPCLMAAAASPRQPAAARRRSRKRPRLLVEALPLEVTDALGNVVCGGVMKPGVTFFGEALNDNVRRCLEADRNKVDALIVIGTSLSVAPISKVIGYLPPRIPRILINRTIVHPAHPVDEDDDGTGKDFRSDYVFDAYLLGFCDDVTRALAKQLFDSDNNNNKPKKKAAAAAPAQQEGKLLATLQEDDEQFNRRDWETTRVPPDRIFLFPGAQPPSNDPYGDSGGGVDDATSVMTYREVAHCDGCAQRIVGTIRKCVTCFDYDLCQQCFPKLSKTHYNGKHSFAEEQAAICDME